LWDGGWLRSSAFWWTHRAIRHQRVGCTRYPITVTDKLGIGVFTPCGRNEDESLEVADTLHELSLRMAARIGCARVGIGGSTGAFFSNITNTGHPNTTSAEIPSSIPSGTFQHDPGRTWGSRDPNCGRTSHQKAYNACRNRDERNVLTARQEDAAQPRPRASQASTGALHSTSGGNCGLTDDPLPPIALSRVQRQVTGRSGHLHFRP
jgi:hypothetical protein